MSILNHSPTIVRDGLVLCLDAGAVRSYPIFRGSNLITNGEFTTNTTGWAGYGGTTISRVTASSDPGVPSGGTDDYCLKVNGTYFAYDPISTTTGKHYFVRLRGYDASGGNSLKISATSDGATLTGVPEVTVSGAEWKTYTSSFIAEGTTTYIRIGANSGGGSVSYWDKVEVYEAIWADLSGYDNDAVLNGIDGLSAESGAGGTRSFDFDGTSDYMTISNPSFAADGFTNGLTCEAWLRFDTASLSGSDTGFITRYSASAQSQFLFGFREAGVGNIGLTLYQIDDSNNAVGLDYDQDWTPATDRWYHVVAVYIPSTKVEIFVDGQSEFSVTSNIPSQLNDDSTLDVMIGNFVGGTYFNGKMAILRMYNRALTIGEAQQNYRTHKGRFGL